MGRPLVRALFALSAAAIAVLSVIPEVPASDLPNADKLEHLAAYAVLGGLALLSAESRRGRALLAVGVVVLGLALEGVQALLPWRTASWADGAANLAGVVLGAGAVLLTRRPRPPRG
jgi:VanZ family protein